MTAYYVRSGAAGAGTGADWANAYTTLTAAFSGKAAGDIFYVSEDHSESTAGTLTLQTPGTASNPCYVICVNHLGSVPPVSADLRTTAQVATSANNSISFNNAGTVYIGIKFIAGNGTGNPFINIATAANSFTKFINCSLQIGSTGAAGSISIGNSGSTGACYTEWVNTTVSFANTGQVINVAGTLRWYDTASALLNTIPSTLFAFIANRGGDLECRGVDFSAAGSGKTIVGNTVSAATSVRAMFMDCKINASATFAATPSAHAQIVIDAVRTGASGVNYNQNRTRYAGTLIEETTVVLTGGASDGTTPLAWRIDTTANAHWGMPFEAPPIAIWNDTTGSLVNAAVQGIWGGGAVPNNDEIWLEVEYLGSSSSPLASFAHDSKADVLASAAGQTAGSGTWGGSTTKFKLDASFTPQQKGWILVRVKAAKASSTFYIDPKVTLT